jgi:hypothetical protein
MLMVDMKASTLGIVLIIVGFLIMLYGFGRSAFDFITPTIGILIMGVGLWILAVKFRQWVHSH